jgi:S-formylglutathione hydrolase FrmB
MPRILRSSFLLVLFWVPCQTAHADDRAPLEFHLTYDGDISEKPFSGRVYVMLFKAQIKEFRGGISWFKPEPVFAMDVKNWKAGDTVVIGKDALAYPLAIEELPKDTYSIQAVMDFDQGAPSFSTADGNGYCDPIRHELDPLASGPIHLKLDKVWKSKPFVEGERLKLVEVESKLLSEFHKHPVTMRAGVVLPKSFATDADKKYPVVYEIPGFSGTYRMALQRSSATDIDGLESLWVVLDPSCRLGHHAFADSDNNGPWGKALVEELIPAIEKKYRALGTPAARLVTGHSSGGWSSLWLQVTYPEFFGGCWSTAPDPVDFRDFQMIDIYKSGTKMFEDESDRPRPIARTGDKPVLFFKGFSDMETVMGHGGQLASFEAVFSPRGKDGQPAKLWDRATGKIDPDVAKSWQRYDIRLILERNWDRLGPKLTGKVHVYTGELDTFYLDGAARLLQESLKKLDSDAIVELFPGKDHGSVLDRKMRERIAVEMARQLRKEP